MIDRVGLERAPERPGDRRGPRAARDPEPERRRRAVERERLAAQPGDEHREQGAGERLHGAPRRAARELGGERQQRERRRAGRAAGPATSAMLPRGSVQVSAIQAAPSAAKRTASPSEMFQSGKNVTAKANASAIRGKASPSAAVAIVSPSGQPAG